MGLPARLVKRKYFRKVSKLKCLLSKAEMKGKEIEFFSTIRGGDITFKRFQQVVGYPIPGLEKFSTDIGKRTAVGLLCMDLH